MSAPVREMNERQLRKREYKKRLLSLLAENKSVMVLNIDNVGSKQLQQTRIKLRGEATFLMGKNTIIRKVLRDEITENGRADLQPLLDVIRGNIGFCFTNGDLQKVREEIQSEVVPAAAKTGQFAPVDVFVNPGPTPLDPGQTSFFQALDIATKITRGAIEILSKVKLCAVGERISASAVALLSRLGLKPFFFGIKVTHVYDDGAFYDAKVMDLTDADLSMKFCRAATLVAQMSLQLRFPTAASLPHSIARAFKYCVSFSLETDYVFEQAKIYKEMVENPDAFKTAAPAEEAAEEAAPAAAEEEEEEEEPAMGMFDDEEGY